MFHIAVKTLAHMEPLLLKEIVAVGAEDAEAGVRIVHCTGDMRMVYRLNYELRTALRVLIHVTQFKARKPDDLYKKALGFPWENLFGVEHTFAIDPNVHSGQYRHPHYAALRLKDAIADRFVQVTGSRPDVNAANPDILLHLHIDDEKVNISLDSSGKSLNQRGYRNSGGTAPLNEVLAAGMLLNAGYTGDAPFYDAMCGSGTLSIEAASIAMNRAPQRMREYFGFMSWPTFDEALWNDVVNEAEARERIPAFPVIPTDVDSRQVKIARENVRSAGLEHTIKPEVADFFTLEPAHDAGILMLNPPYGERMDEVQIAHFYKRMGERFKHHWPGFRAWVISSDREALKEIGLKPFRKQELFNGNLMCRFVGYELYSGSKKAVSVTN